MRRKRKKTEDNIFKFLDYGIVEDSIYRFPDYKFDFSYFEMDLSYYNSTMDYSQFQVDLRKYGIKPIRPLETPNKCKKNLTYRDKRKSKKRL